MKFIKDRRFEFMAFRRIALGISLVLVLGSLALFAFKGLNLGMQRMNLGGRRTGNKPEHCNSRKCAGRND